MKTVRQLFQITERTAKCLEKMPVRSIMDFDNEAGLLLSDFTDEFSSVRDKNLPLLQFNYDNLQEPEIEELFSRIHHNVKDKTHATLLPDGRFTHDEFGSLVIETPSVMTWQNGGAGRNYVITYDNSSEEDGRSRLNQLITDMLLSLPGKSIKLHFVDFTYSAQCIFLTRHLDNSIYGKLISSRNDWEELMKEMRAKMSKSVEDYGDVVSYNEENKKIVVPYDVIVITDYRKSLSYLHDLRPFFENGSKGGIYFVLMNNENHPLPDFSNDSLLTDRMYYQEMDVRNMVAANSRAFVKFTPFLQNKSFVDHVFNSLKNSL